LSLRSLAGCLRAGLVSHVGKRTAAFSTDRPLVSFCFDDFPRTAYTNGASILKHFGAHGTFYAAPGLMNTSTVSGEQARLNDMDALLAEGHELGCHTYSHVSCRERSPIAFEDEVLRGRTSLFQMTGSDPANFAYPYGHVSVRSKGVIGSHMTSCRGIYGGINEVTVDLNLLRANSMYGDLDGLPRIATLVAKNVEQKGWLLLYTHDVREDPSPFGCTPALLEAAVLLALETGCQIATVKKVIDIHVSLPS
jgi:peptidoglycan/xylan/chitin deacetylase (PgdA/CDA1 family)